jgi:hypothetical protein
MKTRSGFVSNSSSSSFIVQRYDRHSKGNPKVTTPEQDRLLKRGGFWLEIAFFPDQVGYPTHEPVAPKDRKIANWCRYTSCNQDDEIFFLIRNKISFDADIHYGHRSMTYDAKTDVLIIAQNFGTQMQMTGTDKMTFAPYKGQKPVETTTGKAYLKKYEDSIRIRQ